ncbi:putative invertase inhibitor [Spinacia oleracea]|uniref:Invertase inhibitor n=1 Tax=Spinacia oleracea TaxID=3562 RepID=A0A9R0IRB4_SPIOL|nr:putative invertase inhibitor [Spinacia oleracea]
MIIILSSIPTLLPLSLLLLLLLAATTTVTTAVESTNLINQTCMTSSISDPNINYNFCINAFQTAPSSLNANLTRLGLISINLVKHNVNSTTFLVQTLLENNKVDNCTKSGLEDCLQLYSNSMFTIREVARDYRARRLNGANVKLSSVMEASTTCEDGFKDVGVGSPLTKHNNDTFQLSAIALSIICMLY